MGSRTSRRHRKRPPRSHANAALTVSVQSVLWTVVGSSLAVWLGLTRHSAVLVAFGAIGFVDAIGSVGLVHHFRKGLREGELSDRLETVVHRIVLVGMAAVGIAAIVGGAVRLTLGQFGSTGSDLVALAAASLVALLALAGRKRVVGRRVSSKALLADAQLSAIGATQAAVALLGVAATRAFGWHSADAVATILIGSIALTIAARGWSLSSCLCKRIGSSVITGRG